VDPKPPSSKELNISSTFCEVVRDLVANLLQALLRLLIAFAFARASALLLAPQA
jgi:hypothetical protein